MSVEKDEGSDLDAVVDGWLTFTEHARIDWKSCGLDECLEQVEDAILEAECRLRYCLYKMGIKSKGDKAIELLGAAVDELCRLDDNA